MIRQGDLARNFASQICCENAGILCVFQGFRSGFVGEKNRQSPQTQLCGVAFNFTAFYRKRPMPIFAVGYINYGIQGEGPAGGGSAYRFPWLLRCGNGAPGKPSVSGFAGERRSSGMSELLPLRQNERYGACDDEGIIRPKMGRSLSRHSRGNGVKWLQQDGEAQEGRLRGRFYGRLGQAGATFQGR